MNIKLTIPALMLVVGLSCPGLALSAGLGDTLKGMLDGIGKDSVSPEVKALSDADVSAGLREALSVGVQKAVKQLGQPDGFLNNDQVRITMPTALKPVEQGLKLAGYGALSDELITSMNRAAEAAVPKAAPIFSDAVKNMSAKDVKAILSGPEDAATKYFRSQTEDSLKKSMLPVVQQATGKVALMESYKKLMAKAGGSKLGGLVSGSKALDLDQYVMQKSLDGLFLKIAEEEKAIRTNPAARGTELLKKVFGAVKP